MLRRGWEAAWPTHTPAALWGLSPCIATVQPLSRMKALMLVAFLSSPGSWLPFGTVLFADFAHLVNFFVSTLGSNLCVTSVCCSEEGHDSWSQCCIFLETW